jgi:hypothetical protein
MLHGEAFGLVVGAVGLGAVHGIEPGHGWPVAASYALDRSNKWLYGLAAGLIIGVGHLVSSIAMVGVFFYAKDFFQLTQLNDPITLTGGVEIGGPVSLVAGLLLIGLGVREYRHGHGHSHGPGPEADEHGDAAHGHDGHDHDIHDYGHDHDGHNHGHDHDSHSHGHDHNGHEHGHEHQHVHDGEHGHDGGEGEHTHGGGGAAVERGLLGIAWFAFVLGFAHEEEFEIIALCAGSTHCLELMSLYAVTVIVGIVTLTMLLIAGYEHYEDRVRQYTPYLPVFSAVVLVTMGVGFVLGIF